MIKNLKKTLKKKNVFTNKLDKPIEEQHMSQLLNEYNNTVKEYNIEASEKKLIKNKYGYLQLKMVPDWEAVSLLQNNTSNLAKAHVIYKDVNKDSDIGLALRDKDKFLLINEKNEEKGYYFKAKTSKDNIEIVYFNEPQLKKVEINIFEDISISSIGYFFYNSDNNLWQIATSLSNALNNKFKGDYHPRAKILNNSFFTKRHPLKIPHKIEIDRTNNNKYSVEKIASKKEYNEFIENIQYNMKNDLYLPAPQLSPPIEKNIAAKKKIKKSILSPILSDSEQESFDFRQEPAIETSLHNYSTNFVSAFDNRKFQEEIEDEPVLSEKNSRQKEEVIGKSLEKPITKPQRRKSLEIPKEPRIESKRRMSLDIPVNKISSNAVYVPVRRNSYSANNTIPIRRKSINRTRNNI